MINDPYTLKGTTYVRRRHAAVRTTDFIFNQLIPYIGNKRKLLDLIMQALGHTTESQIPTFLDMFSGSGVVARLAKTLGYRVIANDWEPYAKVINGCYIANNTQPDFEALGGYKKALDILNNLPPRVDWITDHLCPRDDEDYDVDVDRMFYMRKNGMRIDAIRRQILEWHETGTIDNAEKDCLLAPLLYQACYTSNTSGVFKGFHNGWGGQTKTALYRIAGDLCVTPAVFFDNGFDNDVLCDDAQRVAERMRTDELDVVYLDPPYNQHPYGSNYHVLNTVALWDKPELSKTITRGNKSAIRLDWRTERRSAYNYTDEAAGAYAKLLQTLNSRFVLTSYSTDGFIPLEKMLEANINRGHVRIEMKGYKRYRVSSQRFSNKPMNVEFVIVLDTHKASDVSVDELHHSVTAKEESVLNGHREYAIQKQEQLVLFEGARGQYVTQTSTQN
jgi:adenine-specific DNA-methyltransferase